MALSLDIYPDTLRLNNHTRDVTLLSGDLERYILIRTSGKIFILDNWETDLFKLEYIIHIYDIDKDRIKDILIFIKTTHMI